MFVKAKKMKLILFVTVLLSPTLVFAQDDILGSSSGSSGSSSKKTTTTKTTSKPKATNSSKPKSTTTAKNTKTSKPKPTPAKTTQVAKNNSKSKNVGSNPTTKQTNNQSSKISNTPVSFPKPTVNIGPAASNNLPPNASIEDQFESFLEEGNMARDERNYLIAENAYNQAKKLKPGDSRAIYGLGNLFSDQQRWELAEKYYRDAVKIDSNSADAFIALSYVLTQPVLGTNLADRYNEAVKHARTAVRLDGNNPIANDQLGVSLEKLGKIDNETKGYYRRAIELDPNYALAHAHLAGLLRKNKQESEAVTAYNNAVRLANDIPTMVLIAEIFQGQQRYADSENLLRKALNQDPKNPIALFLYGRALMVRNKLDEAERVLQKSITISPNSYIPYSLLGALYLRSSSFENAEKTFMQAIKVSSASEKKQLAQHFIEVGDGYMRLRKKTEAIRVYKKAQELDSRNSELNEKLVKASK